MVASTAVLWGSKMVALKAAMSASLMVDLWGRNSVDVSVGRLVELLVGLMAEMKASWKVDLLDLLVGC